MPSFVRFEEVTADLGAPLVDGPGQRDQYRRAYYSCAKEAATALRLRKGENRSAMPIMFMYRQYLELALKDALEKSKAFDLVQSEDKFGHDVENLWNEAQRVLTTFVPKDLLDSINPTLEIIHAIDKRADAFRYATNPAGTAQMPENAHVIYQELIDKMEEAHTVLELAIDEIRIEETKLDAAIAEAVAKDKT